MALLDVSLGKTMKFKAIFVIAFMVSFLIAGTETIVYSQTCSCAGAPVFNPFEYTNTDKDSIWHFRLSYKYHAINDLVEGSERVIDDTDRSRIAQSIFFETAFNLNKRISFTALLNYSSQQRSVGISNFGVVSTGSIGDSMLSVQYSPLIYEDRKEIEIAMGGGLKAPTGASNVALIGVASEDMQPGTGSWDFIIWGYARVRLNFINGLEFFTGLSFRLNGQNKREYKFGNEFTSTIGLRLIAKKKIDLALNARYRHASGDQRFNSLIPNTGGDWIYIAPRLIIKLSEKIGINAELELPVYRRLKGFRQFTSTFLVSFSVFFKI